MKLRQSLVKNIYRLIPILLLALLMGGCLKNEVKVSFKLSGEISETYILGFYASDRVKGWYSEIPVTLHGKEWGATCITRNPTLVFVSSGNGQFLSAFYAERGDDIEITGDLDPLSWNITGNDINEEWSEWRLKHREALSRKNWSSTNEAVGEYVKEHSENPLSTILLLVYYNRNEDPEGFDSLWKSLRGEAKEPKWTELVGPADMVNGDIVSPQSVGRIVLSSLGAGVDTIEIGKKPVLLYFWRGGDDDRSFNMQELRKISREYSDSTKRIIADISFETDSTSWSYRLPADSLRGVSRCWLPIGENDSVMMRLGVDQTPYIIVFDSKGKATYRGKSMEKASATFRGVMGK